MPSLIDHLDRLRRHSAWADARLLAALEAAPPPFRTPRASWRTSAARRRRGWRA